MAPQLLTRTLTFNFAPSAGSPGGVPNVVEIALLPLDNSANNTAGATYAGGLQSTTVELTPPGPCTAVFDLVPSYSPGLSSPITYRVMWRAGVLGRTYTYDFSMPDNDTTWDALQSVGGIIDGRSYVQQIDLGVPGGVARLNSNGEVVDSAGNPVVNQAALQALTTALSDEVTQREDAVSVLRSTLESEMAIADASALSAAQSYTDDQLAPVEAALTAETFNRTVADEMLQNQISTQQTNFQSDFTTLSQEVAATSAALPSKADLDSYGKILVDEIPDLVITSAFSVPNQAAMLALTYPTCHQGDLAVRPDGVWMLQNNEPSLLGSWLSLTTVSSVNGQRGTVSLGPSDLVPAAIPAGGAIDPSQVTGLTTALSGKASASAVAALTTAVQSIQTDPTLVHTVGGVIPHSLLDSSMVYLDNNGKLVQKDGTPIAVGSSGGSGAVFSVNGKTGVVVLSASDVGARPSSWVPLVSDISGLQTTLTSHANSLTSLSGQISSITGDATIVRTVSGLLPLGIIPALSTGQITGLNTLISGNQLTSTTNAINRIASLEGQIATLGSGGGGGGGTSSTSTFFTSSNTTTPVMNYIQNVNLHSPWGIDSDGTITGLAGTWYYLYTGVRSVDTAFPSISKNGHLSLSRWNENGAPDPVYALQTDLSALSTTVSGKAAQSALSSLSTTVSGKANASDLSALSSVVDTKASQSDLQNLSTIVSGKANASDLTYTNNQVSLKANQTDMATVQGQITTINTTLTHKAPLDTNNLVPLANLPTIPSTQVSGLTSGISQTTMSSAFYTSSMVKRADYVATGTALSSVSGGAPNGLQSVDGVTPPAGAIVLATVGNTLYRGLWVVSAGTWTRPPDYYTGNFVAKDTLVVVTNKSAGQPGFSNNYTIWQMTNSTPTVAVIDTDPTSWTQIAYCAPGFAPTQGNGISVTGQTVSVLASPINLATGNVGGISVTSTGVDINTSVVPRKYVATITPTTPIVTIQHNLGTWYPSVTIWDANANILVLAGVQTNNVNSISIEFASGNGKYVVVCLA